MVATIKFQRTSTESDVKTQQPGRVLVTGGAGYIGSHTTLRLLESGYKVVIVDNLCNAYRKAIKNVKTLAACDDDDLIFITLSLLDKDKLTSVFKKYAISAVVHFAGLKSVFESQLDPLRYYANNVTATMTLLECMNEFNVKTIVFSSSATVYGDAQDAYIKEDAPTNPLTPYGRSKLMCEQIIADVCKTNTTSAVLLRYFNPVGCHPSGFIGENPRNIPNNLMPCVTDAMIYQRVMKVFGNDYDTPDGTAIRDFIHVMDLAEGHVAALRKLEKLHGIGGFCEVYNMGNGVGASVMQVIETMQDVSHVTVPFEIAARRAGDAQCVVADPTKAKKELHWTPYRTLTQMCESAWNWKRAHPRGYETRTRRVPKAIKEVYHRMALVVDRRVSQ